MAIHDPSFRAFFDEDYSRLVSALALVTGDHEVATEAVAEAVARAWEQVQRGRDIDCLGGWIRVVSLNVARSTFRRRAVERRARAQLQREADALQVTDHDDCTAEVHRLLATLPRRQREVFVMRHFIGLSTAAVAADLGISEGTVKSALHRARLLLAARLGQESSERAEDEEVAHAVR